MMMCVVLLEPMEEGRIVLMRLPVGRRVGAGEERVREEEGLSLTVWG